MLEAIPFIDLLLEPHEIEALLFNDYSALHYMLIDKLVFTDKGYVIHLQHQVSHLLNQDHDARSPENILSCLRSVLGLQHYLADERLAGSIGSFKPEQSTILLERAQEYVKKVAATLDGDSKDKIGYSAIVVDDQSESRTALEGFLDQHFEEVNVIETTLPQHFISHADKCLLKGNTSYDVIFLDILYLQENGNWFAKNGLDYYKEIKSRHPFTVVVVMTALPRSIVSSLAKLIDSEGIPYHLLLSKCNGKEAMFVDLKEKLPDIIADIVKRHNEKLHYEKISMPNAGHFSEKSNPGIRARLHLEICREGERFEKAIGEASKLCEDVRNRQTIVKTLGLPSTKNRNFEAIWRKMPQILTGRLIALSGGGKYFDNNRIKNELGFNTITEGERVVIQHQNLFPHEWVFLNRVSEQNETTSIDGKWAEYFLADTPVKDMIRILSKMNNDPPYTFCDIYDENDDEWPHRVFTDSITVDWINKFLDCITRRYNDFLAFPGLVKNLRLHYEDDEGEEYILPDSIRQRFDTLTNM